MLLSDLAFEALPHAFMSSVFPLASEKLPGVPLPTIDAAPFCAGSSPTAPVLALAIALLYDSPAEAFAELER